MEKLDSRKMAFDGWLPAAVYWWQRRTLRTQTNATRWLDYTVNAALKKRREHQNVPESLPMRQNAPNKLVQANSGGGLLTEVLTHAAAYHAVTRLTK